MTNTKITRKARLETLIQLFNGDIVIADIADTADYVDFFNKEIVALDKKAAKAKETAAKKRAESDALTDRLEGVLTADFTSIADLLVSLNDEDVTPQKAAIRLSKLADAGKAEKGEIVIPGVDGKKARKIVAYKAI